MSTPEAKVKAKLMAYLRANGFYWFMPVQTGYGASSLDFLACRHGKFYAFETKRKGANLTPRQMFVGQQITDAGGEVYKVTLVNKELEFTPWHSGSTRSEVL